MDSIKIAIKLKGISPIMFDKFHDHSKDKRNILESVYLSEDKLVFPTENIYAFLLNENPTGCARLFEGKKGKNYVKEGFSHILLDHADIPFTTNGKEIILKDLPHPQFYVSEFAPRTKQGTLSIKQETKKRLVLKLPWELSFDLELMESDLIDATKLKSWFVQGGMMVALGTYRPRFGRFSVEKFEINS